MNILYISADRGIPVRGMKGAAVHIRSLCAAFAESGHSVTLLTPRPGPLPGQGIRANIIHVPLPDGDQDGETRAIVHADDLYAAASKELRRGNYDFIYERYSLWSDVGGRLAEATGLPFVLEVNAPLLEEAARFRTLENVGKAREVELRQVMQAKVVSVVSEPLAAYVRARGAAPENILVLPNGVDPVHFHPAVRGGRIHHRYGLNRKKIIGFAGRARPWHDLETLLAAFAQIQETDPSTHLLLVGQMPDDLDQKLDSLGIRDAVTATGVIPHKEVPEHIAAMDVAVSSHAALDGFYFSPLKLFEYMACGVPVVAADTGQPAELIEPGVNGERYRPGDPDDLARKIGKLLTNPEYANELAWNGAVLVLGNYTWERNAREVVRRIAPVPETPAFSENGHTIELPIFDRKLRQRLYRATRADIAESLLRRKGPDRKKYARLTHIEPLKYKPGRRCVMRYTWEKGKTGRAELIGKVFRDRRGQRLDAVHRILWESGFDNQVVRIPRPYGYVHKMRMQLQENAPGITLNEIYRSGGDVYKYMSLCAAAAAQLHDLNDHLPDTSRAKLHDLIKPYFLEDEIHSLGDTFNALRELRPAETAELTHMFDLLLGWADILHPPAAPALVHRDFYYSQVLVDGESLVLIDLDLIASGDAAIDVANFSAHLNFLGLETRGDFYDLAAAAEEFKAEYEAIRPQDAAFWDRVSFYETSTLYRLLRVVALRPNKAHIFEPLLEQTLKFLEVA